MESSNLQIFQNSKTANGGRPPSKGTRFRGNSTSSFQMTNLNLKKRLTFEDDEKILEAAGKRRKSQPCTQTLMTKQKFCDARNHKNLVRLETKTLNGSQLDQYEYVDLQTWWKTYKSVNKRSPEDLAPMTYDDDVSPWDYLTTAIVDRFADEHRQLKNEIKFIKNGNYRKEDRLNGYQYLIGSNFPVMFQKCSKPKLTKKRTANIILKSQTVNKKELDQEVPPKEKETLQDSSINLRMDTKHDEDTSQFSRENSQEKPTISIKKANKHSSCGSPLKRRMTRLGQQKSSLGSNTFGSSFKKNLPQNIKGSASPLMNQQSRAQNLTPQPHGKNSDVFQVGKFVNQRHMLSKNKKDREQRELQMGIHQELVKIDENKNKNIDDINQHLQNQQLGEFENQKVMFQEVMNVHTQQSQNELVIKAKQPSRYGPEPFISSQLSYFGRRPNTRGQIGNGGRSSMLVVNKRNAQSTTKHSLQNQLPINDTNQKIQNKSAERMFSFPTHGEKTSDQKSMDVRLTQDGTNSTLQTNFFNPSLSQNFRNFNNEAIRISELLDTNTLTRGNGSENKQKSRQLRMAKQRHLSMTQASAEQYSFGSPRDQIGQIKSHKYRQNFMTRFSDQQAEFIPQIEQKFVENLLLQDKLVKKQIQLYENYGQKQKGIMLA